MEHASAAEYPCATTLAGGALHGGASRPIEIRHDLRSLPSQRQRVQECRRWRQSPKDPVVERDRPLQPLDPPPSKASYPMNGSHRQCRIVLYDAQKCGCRSRGASPVLFPVLKCLHAYTDQIRKLRLRKAGPFANNPDPGRADRNAPRRLLLAPQNRPGFAYAAQQFLKHLFFHLPNSSLTTLASCETCFGVKSVAAFFGYA